MSVVISASAPGTRRPVCPSGNRFCSGLESRTEVVLHEVHSADAQFNGIDVHSVDMSVSVTHDASDPPKVLTSLLSHMLNAVLATFNQPTNRAGLSGTFACTRVLALSTAEAEARLGTGSFCAFTSPSTLKITLGRSATELPGGAIGLLDLTLKAASASASLFTMNETFAVGQPLVPTVPVAAVASSSLRVGRCDDLTLDASGTHGSGGRALAYHFNATLLSGAASIANVTEVLAAVNAGNDGEGSHRAVVPSAAMPLGASFDVTMTVTNFLGNSDSTTVRLTKLSVPAPVLTVQGANPRLTTHGAELTLQVTTELPTMTCVQEVLANAKMEFLWFEDTGKFTGPLHGTSKNPRMLHIPAGSLAALESYSFRVIGFMTDSPNLNNTATVAVTVSQQSVIARIAGGGLRQVGRSSTLALDGSGSEDPDESSEPFEYSWECSAMSASASCADLPLFATAIVSVAPDTLAIGMYQFTLTVTKGARSDSAAAAIDIVSGSPPIVTIDALTSAKYNADTDFLSVSGSVASSLGVTSVWTMEGSDVAAPFLAKGLPIEFVANKNYAAVSLASLTPGSQYTIRLSATDSAGESTFSAATLLMNEAPTSGSISISPAAGSALETSFLLAALNWVDDDIPFTYVFGTARVHADGSADTSELFPFGNERSDPSLAGVTLAQGDEATNYSVSSLHDGLLLEYNA